MKKFSILLTAAALAVTAEAQAATIIVDYTFEKNGHAVSSGSFSYDSSLAGVLGYSDLGTFVLNMPEHTYDLAFINSGDFSSWRYFGYDTTTGQFVANDSGGYELLSAIKSNFNEGFFFGCAPSGCINDYADNKGDFSYDNVTYRAAELSGAVPEPSTWAMMLLGFGALGGAMRRRRQNFSVSYA